MKKVLPLILLFVGIGAGVGAGILLRPDAQEIEVADVPIDEQNSEENVGSAKEQSDEPKIDEDQTPTEFVKFNNQFVIPIVNEAKITSLVVMALSIEVPGGKSEDVYLREPKLRDSFLQVLFDHANIGGFEGNFTDAETLGRLRTALTEIAERDIGAELVKDVLIVEIARQDY